MNMDNVLMDEDDDVMIERRNNIQELNKHMLGESNVQPDFTTEVKSLTAAN